jgi:hypothetical protein
MTWPSRGLSLSLSLSLTLSLSLSLSLHTLFPLGLPDELCLLTILFFARVSEMSSFSFSQGNISRGQAEWNNFSRCLIRRLPRPKDAGTPSNSTRCPCHLGGRPSKYLPGLMLLDFGDQMGTGSNVAKSRSLSHEWLVSGDQCSQKKECNIFVHHGNSVMQHSHQLYEYE